MSWYRGERERLWGIPAPSSDQRVIGSTVAASAVLTCSRLSSTAYPNRLMAEPDHFAGLKILEVGCGPMGLSLGFTGCSIWGLDPLVDEYRAAGYPIDEFNSRLRLVEGFAENMPFEDDSFDAVISVNAIDHVDDFETSAEEISRVLKPGGLLRMEVHYHRPTLLEPQALDDQAMVQAFGRLGIRMISEHAAGSHERVVDAEEAITIWATGE